MAKGNGKSIPVVVRDFIDMGKKVRSKTSSSRNTAVTHYQEFLRTINRSTSGLLGKEQCSVELLGKFASYLFETRKAPAYKTALSYLTGVKMHFEKNLGTNAYIKHDGEAFGPGAADYVNWYSNIRFRTMKAYLKRNIEEEKYSERATEAMYRFHLLIFCRHYLVMQNSKRGLFFRIYVVCTSQCCGRAGELSITLYDQLAFDFDLQMLRFRWCQEKTAASKDVLIAPECTDYVICAYHSIACYLLATRHSTEPLNESPFIDLESVRVNSSKPTGVFGEVYKNSYERAKLPTGAQTLTPGSLRTGTASTLANNLSTTHRDDRGGWFGDKNTFGNGAAYTRQHESWKISAESARFLSNWPDITKGGRAVAMEDLEELKTNNDLQKAVARLTEVVFGYHFKLQPGVKSVLLASLFRHHELFSSDYPKNVAVTEFEAICNENGFTKARILQYGKLLQQQHVQLNFDGLPMNQLLDADADAPVLSNKTTAQMVLENHCMLKELLSKQRRREASSSSPSSPPFKLPRPRTGPFDTASSTSSFMSPIPSSPPSSATGTPAPSFTTPAPRLSSPAAPFTTLAPPSSSPPSSATGTPAPSFTTLAPPSSSPPSSATGTPAPSFTTLAPPSSSPPSSATGTPAPSFTTPAPRPSSFAGPSASSSRPSSAALAVPADLITGTMQAFAALRWLFKLGIVNGERLTNSAEQLKLHGKEQRRRRSEYASILYFASICPEIADVKSALAEDPGKFAGEERTQWEQKIDGLADEVLKRLTAFKNRNKPLKPEKKKRKLVKAISIGSLAKCLPKKVISEFREFIGVASKPLEVTKDDFRAQNLTPDFFQPKKSKRIKT